MVRLSLPGSNLTQKQKRRRRKTWQRWISQTAAAATAIGVLFAGMGLYFTHESLASTQKQVEAAQEQLIVQQHEFDLQGFYPKVTSAPVSSGITGGLYNQNNRVIAHTWMVYLLNQGRASGQVVGIWMHFSDSSSDVEFGPETGADGATCIEGYPIDSKPEMNCQFPLKIPAQSTVPLYITVPFNVGNRHMYCLAASKSGRVWLAITYSSGTTYDASLPVNIKVAKDGCKA